MCRCKVRVADSQPYNTEKITPQILKKKHLYISISIIYDNILAHLLFVNNV